MKAPAAFAICGGAWWACDSEMTSNWPLKCAICDTKNARCAHFSRLALCYRSPSEFETHMTLGRARAGLARRSTLPAVIPPHIGPTPHEAQAHSEARQPTTNY